MSPHPTGEQLQSLLDDCVAKTEYAAVRAHVEQCARCQRLLERLASDPPVAHWRAGLQGAPLVPRGGPSRASPGRASMNAWARRPNERRSGARAATLSSMAGACVINASPSLRGSTSPY